MSSFSSTSTSTLTSLLFNNNNKINIDDIIKNRNRFFIQIVNYFMFSNDIKDKHLFDIHTDLLSRWLIVSKHLMMPNQSLSASKLLVYQTIKECCDMLLSDNDIREHFAKKINLSNSIRALALALISHNNDSSSKTNLFPKSAIQLIVNLYTIFWNAYPTESFTNLSDYIKEYTLPNVPNIHRVDTIDYTNLDNDLSLLKLKKKKSKPLKATKTTSLPNITEGLSSSISASSSNTPPILFSTSAYSLILPPSSSLNDINKKNNEEEQETIIINDNNGSSSSSTVDGKFITKRPQSPSLLPSPLSISSSSSPPQSDDNNEKDNDDNEQDDSNKILSTLKCQLPDTIQLPLNSSTSTSSSSSSSSLLTLILPPQNQTANYYKLNGYKKFFKSNTGKIYIIPSAGKFRHRVCRFLNFNGSNITCELIPCLDLASSTTNNIPLFLFEDQIKNKDELYDIDIDEYKKNDYKCNISSTIPFFYYLQK